MTELPATVWAHVATCPRVYMNSDVPGPESDFCQLVYPYRPSHLFNIRCYLLAESCDFVVAYPTCLKSNHHHSRQAFLSPHRRRLSMYHKLFLSELLS